MKLFVERLDVFFGRHVIIAGTSVLPQRVIIRIHLFQSHSIFHFICCHLGLCMTVLILEISTMSALLWLLTFHDVSVRNLTNPPLGLSNTTFTGSTLAHHPKMSGGFIYKYRPPLPFIVFVFIPRLVLEKPFCVIWSDPSG